MIKVPTPAEDKPVVSKEAPPEVEKTEREQYIEKMEKEFHAVEEDGDEVIDIEW